MSIDRSLPQLALNLLPHPYHLLQYPSSQMAKNLAPSSDESGGFLSITYTPQELSIVISSEAGRSREEIEDALGLGATTEYEGPWRAIKIAGPMDLALTGILYALTTPLRNSQIPIFALSTWNTDYVLIPWDRTDDAQKSLQLDGWTVKTS